MQLRISQSIIALWLAGEYEEAIQALHGNWREPSEAMEYGTKRHEEWEKHVKKTGTLPKEFGSKKLFKYQTEIKVEKKINDWITLVGIADLYHFIDGNKPALLDYKTGKTPASQYASSKQHRIYKLLFPEAELFDYYGYNQHEDIVTGKQIGRAHV